MQYLSADLQQVAALIPDKEERERLFKAANHLVDALNDLQKCANPDNIIDVYNSIIFLHMLAAFTRN